MYVIYIIIYIIYTYICVCAYVYKVYGYICIYNDFCPASLVDSDFYCILSIVLACDMFLINV